MAARPRSAKAVLSINSIQFTTQGKYAILINTSCTVLSRAYSRRRFKELIKIHIVHSIVHHTVSNVGLVHDNMIIKHPSAAMYARAYCSLTKIAAIPIPEPIHMLVQNTLPPVCFAMFRPVATCRAPAAQNGPASACDNDNALQTQGNAKTYCSPTGGR